MDNSIPDELMLHWHTEIFPAALLVCGYVEWPMVMAAEERLMNRKIRYSEWQLKAFTRMRWETEVRGFYRNTYLSGFANNDETNDHVSSFLEEFVKWCRRSQRRTVNESQGA